MEFEVDRHAARAAVVSCGPGCFSALAINEARRRDGARGVSPGIYHGVYIPSRGRVA